MQKSTCFKRNGFGSGVYKTDIYVVTNWSVRLEKHHTIEIFMVDFLRIFKNVAFFKKIEIHQ